MEDSGGLRPLPHHHLPPAVWSPFVYRVICISLSSHASLYVSRPEVQKACDVFVSCLRAQLGICS